MVHDKLIVLDRKQNNLDFLRFVAASLVLFSHCYPLFNNNPEPIALRLGVDTGGGLAVCAFFVISGFLVTKSYIMNNNAIVFTANRILRIFPALVMVVLITLLIMGTFCTDLKISSFFFHPMTLDYLSNMWLQVRFNLPGVFESNPLRAVNGSLWTLPVESLMYISILILGIIGILKRWVLASLIGCLLVMELYLYLMTYAFAIFSWHFIEKRALAYKSKVRKIDGLRKKNICRQKLSNLNHG